MLLYSTWEAEDAGTSTLDERTGASSDEYGLRWMALCRFAELWAGGGWLERGMPADRVLRSTDEMVPKGFAALGMKLLRPQFLLPASRAGDWDMTEGEE
jgi:hypothetical protein